MLYKNTELGVDIVKKITHPRLYFDIHSNPDPAQLLVTGFVPVTPHTAQVKPPDKRDAASLHVNHRFRFCADEQHPKELQVRDEGDRQPQVERYVGQMLPQPDGPRSSFTTMSCR